MKRTMVSWWQNRVQFLLKVEGFLFHPYLGKKSDFLQYNINICKNRPIGKIIGSSILTSFVKYAPIYTGSIHGRSNMTNQPVTPPISSLTGWIGRSDFYNNEVKEWLLGWKGKAKVFFNNSLPLVTKTNELKRCYIKFCWQGWTSVLKFGPVIKLLEYRVIGLLVELLYHWLNRMKEPD
jgi:hypothetical protein